MTQTQQHERGFTLIELIVVVAVIATVVLLVGPAFRTNDSASLRESESVLAGLLRTARSIAIMKSTRARLVVSADSTSNENYLMHVAVVAKNSAGSWNVVGSPVKLPMPAKVVPDSAPPTAAGVSWPASEQSSFSGTDTISIVGLPGGAYFYLEFTETGGITNGRKIVLALSSRSTETVSFTSPDQFREFVMRASGAYTVIRESGSL